MARPSKLTDKQWSDILRRSIEGEATRALAREYNVTDGAIRARVITHQKTIKASSEAIVEAECAIKELPVFAQVIAHDYMAALRTMKADLAKAASIGAKNAARMHQLASKAIDQAESAEDGLIDAESLRLAAGVTKAGNDAAAIALDLMRINKDSGQDDAPEDHKPPAMIQLVAPGG